VGASFALREALIIRLEDRVEDQLAQEVLELERLVEQGRDPQTGKPFGSDLDAVFDLYFERNVPSDDEALVAFVEGRLHRAVLSRYPTRAVPLQQRRRWAQLSNSATAGTDPFFEEYETELGTAHQAVLPIGVGATQGAFVVSLLPADQLREIGELRRNGLLFTLGMVLLASVVGWFAAGRVLEPLRLITETARSISRSDLSSRVPVRGTDEGAEMAETFNAMLDRLEAVFESQRRFLREASHELRAPLTISIGQLDVLSDDRRSERRRMVELVIDELMRAADIVHHLRVLAEAELPSFIHPEPVELEKLSHELFEKATALAPRSWVLQATGDGTVRADRYRLTEAVMNVVQNAVQHTDEGDVISLGTTTENGSVRFWVKDPGPGVADSDRQRILEPFERGRDAIRRYRGAGLGLAIVRAIAEAHGGWLEFESKQGAGSTFSIVLPKDEQWSRRADLAEGPEADAGKVTA
jgi:two-component system, OmpR family, sensor kinase